MKLLILILISSNIFSQDHIKPFSLNDNNRLYLDEVFEITGTKSELMKKSAEWIARGFNDGKEVEQFTDEEKGLIIGKATIDRSSFGNGGEFFYFTLNIYHKENKARLVIDDIYIHFKDNPYAPKEKQPYLTWYYKKGDINKKALKNRKKIKAKRQELLQSIIEDWKKSFTIDNGYSDF